MEEKQKLNLEMRRRHILRTIKNGFWSLPHRPAAVKFVSCIFAWIAVCELWAWATPPVIQGLLRACQFLITPAIVVAALYCAGYIPGSWSMYRNLVRVGLVNSAGEAPYLIGKNDVDGQMEYIFHSRGITAARWRERLEEIESALNLTIGSIRPSVDFRTLTIRAVPPNMVFGQTLMWNSALINYNDNSDFILGKTAAGEVVRWNCETMPHVLIGGATSSGKTRLAMVMLEQALLRDTDVKIIDLKGLDYVDPSMLTIREWSESWLAGLVGVKESTAYVYKRDLELYILPAFGNKKLQKLEKSDVKKWIKALSDRGLSPKTVKDIHGVLHKMLEEAVDENKISHNPAHKCPLPKPVKPEINHFENEDLTHFLNAITGHVHERLYKVALFSGIRENEACGLCWDCVDFRNNTINIKRQLWRNRETGEYKLVKPKDDEIRVLVVPPSVMEILREQKRSESAKQAVLGSKWEGKGMVFSNPTGGYLSYRTVYDCYKRITRKLGLEVRFHELRHAYAALSLQGGDDIKTVQEHMGHATSEFTLKVYAHVNRQMQEKSAARMENTIQAL